MTTERGRARYLKRTQGLDVLIIDYLQLLKGSSKENRVQEVSEITQGLKAIAKELNIPVAALPQLSRQVESRENKRPQLSDLRESGSIEQDADVVMFVYHDEYYKEPEKPGDHELEKMAQCSRSWKTSMARPKSSSASSGMGPSARSNWPSRAASPGFRTSCGPGNKAASRAIDPGSAASKNRPRRAGFRLGRRRYRMKSPAASVRFPVR